MKYCLIGKNNYNPNITVDAINPVVANQKSKELFYGMVEATIQNRNNRTVEVLFTHQGVDLFTNTQVNDNIDEVLIKRAWKVFRQQYGNEMQVVEVK